MQKSRFSILSLLFGVLALAHTVASTAQAVSKDRPVVLELFTSQGCSSCPPADALLTELAKQDGVIALSFHVDYWDYIGWKDEHALPISTERQRAYAQRLNLRYVYTPQIVVDGIEQTVGSKLPEIHNCIAETADNPRMKIQVDAGGVVTVSMPDGAQELDRPMDLIMVSYEPWVTSRIGRGENRGKTLGYTNSVRYVDKVGLFGGMSSTFKLPELKTDGAVLLVQDRGHGAIYGALELTK